MLFGRWFKVKDIESYHELIELMLLEQIKNILPKGLKLYLEERKVETMRKASQLADNYVLTHRSSSKFHTPVTKERNTKQEYETKALPKGKSCSVLGSKSQNPDHKSRVNCYYCKQEGHMLATCPKLKKKGRVCPLICTVEDM